MRATRRDGCPARVAAFTGGTGPGARPAPAATDRTTVRPRGGSRADHHPATVQWWRTRHGAHEGAQARPEQVARNRRTHRSTDRERDARRLRVGVVEIRAPQRRAPGSATVAGEPIEGSPVADAPDQAERRVRPLRRRDLMIARPARVAFAPGSRACGPGGACWAGRCASRRTPCTGWIGLRNGNLPPGRPGKAIAGLPTWQRRSHRRPQG